MNNSYTRKFSSPFSKPLISRGKTTSQSHSKKSWTRSIPFKNVFLIILAINAGMVVLIFFLKNALPPQLPLYYGLPQGEEQLAPSWALVIPAAISLAVLLVNIFLASITKDDFVKKVLVGTSLALTVITTITTLKIILLIGSF